MNAAVISFPGSNCDDDLMHAIGTVLGERVTKVAASATTLTGFDLVLVPGGFSYGDYLRSGAIAKFAPIMPALTAFAAAGGYVLGICNGFQILTEAGLLPGALQWNTSLQFICEPEPLVVANAHTAFSNRYQAGQAVTLPIAHGEGNYYADPATLQAIEANGQVVFRYAHNPNGSLNDIAGLTNAAGNVLGMMPHPERAVEQLIFGTDGLGVFESLKEAIEEGAYAAN